MIFSDWHKSSEADVGLVETWALGSQAACVRRLLVVKSDGKNLYTQQLFWNQQTKKIYSNVDSKIVQNDGRDVFIGEGFESDEEFKDWRFRRMKGRMEVEVKPTEQEVASGKPGGGMPRAGLRQP